MEKRKKGLLSVFVSLFIAMGISNTAAIVGAEKVFAEGVEVSGLVDVYYSYNFNNPDSPENGFRVFDVKDNQLAVNLAEVVFEKSAGSPGDVGFRVDLDYGSTADIVGTATPDEEVYKDIQQAYISYLAPVGDGLTIDIGKFVTHMGLEVIESIDNWNYTRSYLYGYAIPFYHAGIRANYPVHDNLYLAGYIYNGWNNVVEAGNNMKTFGLQVGVTPVEALSLILNWIGPESSDEAGSEFSKRHVYDVILSYDLDERTSFMLNYDYGSQDGAAGENETWTGFAVYARHQHGKYAGVIRYEWYDDEDGATGIMSKVQEVTLTAERSLNESLNVRAEFRHDSADDDIFEDEGGAVTDSQDTIVLGLVYSF